MQKIDLILIIMKIVLLNIERIVKMLELEEQFAKNKEWFKEEKIKKDIKFHYTIKLVIREGL